MLLTFTAVNGNHDSALKFKKIMLILGKLQRK